LKTRGKSSIGVSAGARSGNDRVTERPLLSGARALHAGGFVVTTLRDHCGMTDIAPNDPGGNGTDSKVAAAARRAVRTESIDRVLSGESEEELFADPFERPRESAR
jgi:hypothetical protein